MAIITLIANYNATTASKHQKEQQDVIQSQRLAAGILLSKEASSFDGKGAYKITVNVENHLADTSFYVKQLLLSCNGASLTQIPVLPPNLMTPGIQLHLPVSFQKSSSQKCQIVASVTDTEGRAADTSPMEIP